MDARRAIDPRERADLLLRDLRSSRSGLSPREAQRRLDQYGPNEIRRREGAGHLRALARQFTHPLALLLWAAAALALVAGIAALAAAIVAVIVLNAAFAFAQELQAERATEALQRMLPPQVRVRRADQAIGVDAPALVPGDVLLIAEGDRLCADARLLEGLVDVDMASLTGESQPVTRSASAVTAATQPLLEAEDLVFSGTLCTSGDAEALVYATGMSTQLGRIAALSQRVRQEVSPLQRQVNRAAQLIAIVAVVAGVVFLAIGATVAGLPLADAATFAIGLLVANVPEGLLPTITLALAVGVRRMARRRALVKRLTAVETLGSTDVICSDKTGTLTEGLMTVRVLWADGAELALEASSPVDGREPFSGILRTAVRCNNATIARQNGAWRRSGDPTESALLLAAAKLGEDVELLTSERDERRRRVHQFDLDLRHFVGRRKHIVHEALADHLALIVIYEFLEQRGTDAVRDAAECHAFDNRGIDDGAAVVSDHVAPQLRLAELGINRNQHEMKLERVARIHLHATIGGRERSAGRHLHDMGCLEPGLQSLGDQVQIRRAGDLGQGHAPVGRPAHRELAVA